jgi:Mycothiol maleylpyruvate isomerase N-terminal domain
MSPGLGDRNAGATERLSALLARLEPADLDRSLGEGWTVKVALGHLAFWDRFAAAALRRWMQAGYSPSGEDSPFINVALEADLIALPSAHVLERVMEAAKAVDETVALTSENLRAGIVAAGEDWALERGRHRLEHVEQIEAALR